MVEETARMTSGLLTAQGFAATAKNTLQESLSITDAIVSIKLILKTQQERAARSLL